MVAQVADAYAARDAIIQYKPDVMTLDVEMPKMSGIEFLRRLLPQYPLPVVMISSLNDKVFDALAAGAVDFINKPSNLDMAQLSVFLKQELVTKVKIASTAKVGKFKHAEVMNSERTLNPAYRDKIVAIGASTGGTEAIFTCATTSILGSALRLCTSRFRNRIESSTTNTLIGFIGSFLFSINRWLYVLEFHFWS
mgnify:CR=1 FL=1